MKNPAPRRVFFGCGFGRDEVPVRQTLLHAEFGRQSAAAAPRRGLNAGGNRVEIYRARRAMQNERDQRLTPLVLFCAWGIPRSRVKSGVIRAGSMAYWVPPSGPACKADTERYPKRATKKHGMFPVVLTYGIERY